MLNIHSFSFNDFQINTFVISNEENECIIVDPGCYYDAEKVQLKDFIDNNNLIPKFIINTHCHIDHILGNSYIKSTYNIPILAHKDEELLIKTAKEHGLIFGFNIEIPPPIDQYIENNEIIKLGDNTLKCYHVPGHSPGSIAFHSENDNFILAGDVLFNGSIGRTDLPGGSYETLINSIYTKLMVLNDDLIVYPGHRPSTTITKEKNE